MCVGCGGCSIRTSGAIPVTIGRLGVYQANLDGVNPDVVAAGSRVCPFSDDASNEDDLAVARFPNLPQDRRVGRHRDVWAGRLTDEVRLVGSSSGGLTSWMVEQLLQRGVVDAVLHVGRGSSAMFEYRISSTPAELVESRKSSYYATTLADVVQAVRGDGRRYAVVGVPCFIKAARLLADEVPDLGAQLVFFVGLVCGHLKSQFYAESLGWQVGIEPDDLASVDFRMKNPDRRANRYDYEAIAESDSTPRSREVASTIDGSWGYGAFQPEACNFCDDVFAETADVVFGDAWLPKYNDDWRGTNIAVSRSAIASEILEAAAVDGTVVLDPLTVDDAAQSQAGNFRHRRMGLRVRLADDIEVGLSVPRKRVEPGRDGVPKGRIPLIRQRRAMSRLSLEAFAAARAAGRYALYEEPMRTAIAEYRRIDAASKSVIDQAKSVAKRLLRR